MSLHRDKVYRGISLRMKIMSVSSQAAPSSHKSRITYILRTMNVRRACRVRLIANIRRREPVAVSTRMIGAAIAASITRARANVSTHDPPHISRQPRIRIIVIDTYLPRGRVARHVRVHKGKHIPARRLVVLPNVRRAQQATFFSRVEMEF